MEYGLEEMTGFSMISDAQQDNLVERFMSDNGTLIGYSVVSGHLRSLSLRVQRNRIKESIARVDPGNSRIRWAVVISSRAYSVAGPNSLWHIDGHHILVTWGFVIHGGIYGFSCLIVFLKCSTNNRSNTVLDLFFTATQRFEWPSRVRSDHGGENVMVWEAMDERGNINSKSANRKTVERCLSCCYTYIPLYLSIHGRGWYLREK